MHDIIDKQLNILKKKFNFCKCLSNEGKRTLTNISILRPFMWMTLLDPRNPSLNKYDHHRHHHYDPSQL